MALHGVCFGASRAVLEVALSGPWQLFAGRTILGSKLGSSAQIFGTQKARHLGLEEASKIEPSRECGWGEFWTDFGIKKQGKRGEFVLGL